MNEAYLEIVELDNGDIVLRPVKAEDDPFPTPLAIIKIPDETKAFLNDKYFELAKCMFHAGIDYVYSEQDMSEDEYLIEQEIEASQKLH